jgi:heptose I phosphotransferase
VSGETFWRRLSHGARRLHERADWPRFAGADWPEHIMQRAVTDRFHAKQGRSTGRLILEADGRRLAVYLKRHYQLPWWRGLLATLWPAAGWSPGLQEWRHLEWARAHGMPVPEAVAAAEYIGPWGRLQSFLAVEELADMLPLHEAVPLASDRLPPERFRRWKRGLIDEMARIARALHARRWFHKDLYLCHFYIPREDTERLPAWRGRVHVIDLHRLQRHPWTSWWWRVKDLAQLLYSSEVAGVEARDRAYFWRTYLRDDHRGLVARCLRRAVLLRWRRYRAHNRKHKARQLAGSGAENG